MPSPSPLPKILLIAATVLAVVAGGKNLQNSKTRKDIREEASNQKGQINGLRTDAKKAIEELATSKVELKTAAEAKAAAEATLAAVKTEAEKAKKDLEGSLAQVQAKDTELDDLKKKMAEAPAPTVAAPTIDPAVQEELTVAKAKVSKLEQEAKAFQTEKEDADKKVAALEAENARRAASMSRPGLEGKVLAVNPNWNFVVLSIGDKQGVVSNSSLIVKRGGNLVGRLRVTSVEPTTSIADILPGSMPKGSYLQPGDVVIFPAGS